MGSDEDLRSLWTRNCKEELRSMTELGLRPNAAAMPLDDLFADGQAQACAAVRRTTMQALERPEDPVRVPIVETDAIVRDLKDPAVRLRCG